jgi:hypothetical protein
MTLRLVSIALTVTNSAGSASYEARFTGGLNILNAQNTWGKSTLIQSIVYALGLEGSQSASRRSPLGPAMTTVIETSRGRSAVLESHVTLTVVNHRGRYMRVRRWGSSGVIDRGLVQVWLGSSEEELNTSQRRDMFVRESGSTTSKVGFHRLLEEYLGWTLPMVPNYANSETRLYIEVLFPLFYVEQKFGWSGVAPRIPTHFGIRDPLRRSTEYVLGLNTLTRLRAREALRAEEAEVGREWSAAVARAHGAAVAENFRVVHLDERPVIAANRRASVVEVNDGGEWLNMSAALDHWRRQLNGMAEIVTTAGQQTQPSRERLAEAERELQRLAANLRVTSERLAMSRADGHAISLRLQAIENDKRHLNDVRRIERLGGELAFPLLAEGRCPTCSQNVDNRQVATGSVGTVDENIRLLDAERATLLSMSEAADQRTDFLAQSAAAANTALSEVRERVRLLKDELSGPSDAPSVAEVQERLRLEGRMRAATRVGDIVGAVEEKLDELAASLDSIRTRRAGLDHELGSSEDAATLERFRSSFRDQLESYNLRSLSPRDITIDEDTLLPTHDGFELAFDVALGMSASDTIRTKWAYHTALLETSRENENAHHLTLLMLDEPRQQETDRVSLRAFLERLRFDSRDSQIIYATSEDPVVLSELLSDIPHHRLPADGSHLIDFRNGREPS